MFQSLLPAEVTLGGSTRLAYMMASLYLAQVCAVGSLGFPARSPPNGAGKGSGSVPGHMLIWSPGVTHKERKMPVGPQSVSEVRDGVAGCCGSKDPPNIIR